MSPICPQPVLVEALTAIHRDTTVAHLGIELSQVGDDFIRAGVPVDARTRQPRDILPGGASVVGAETLDAWGAICSVTPGHGAIGLDMNANPLRRTHSGRITGMARPAHIGRGPQGWQIGRSDGRQQPTHVTRLAMTRRSARA